MQKNMIGIGNLIDGLKCVTCLFPARKSELTEIRQGNYDRVSFIAGEGDHCITVMTLTRHNLARVKVPVHEPLAAPLRCSATLDEIKRFLKLIDDRKHYGATMGFELPPRYNFEHPEFLYRNPKDQEDALDASIHPLRLRYEIPEEQDRVFASTPATLDFTIGSPVFIWDIMQQYLKKVVEPYRFEVEVDKLSKVISYLEKKLKKDELISFAFSNDGADPGLLYASAGRSNDALIGLKEPAPEGLSDFSLSLKFEVVKALVAALSKLTVTRLQFEFSDASSLVAVAPLGIRGSGVIRNPETLCFMTMPMQKWS